MMFSFRKSDALQSSQPAVPMRKGLPPGFDNPDSLLFVPEELRVSYVAASESKAGRNQDTDWMVRNAATIKAQHDLADEYNKMSNSAFNASVIELAEQLQTDSYFEMLEYGIHLENIQKATTLQKRKAVTEATKLETRRKHTCPVCNQFDIQNNGHVESRPLTLVPRFSSDGIPHIRSCQVCFEVAMSEYRIRKSNEQVIAADDWTQTRSEAVREQLAFILNM